MPRLRGAEGAVCNEVLQFFLISTAGLRALGLAQPLEAVGGWQGLTTTLDPSYLHVWKGMAHPETNRLGVDVGSLVMGLGFVLSFGYWTTTSWWCRGPRRRRTPSGAARRQPLIARLPGECCSPFWSLCPASRPWPQPPLPLSLANRSNAWRSGERGGGRSGDHPIKLDAAHRPAHAAERGEPSWTMTWPPRTC